MRSQSKRIPSQPRTIGRSVSQMREQFAQLEVDERAVVDLTQRLVRTPSVYRPAQGMTEAAAAELVAAEMRSLGWEPVVEEVEKGRPNVHAVIEGGSPGPTLMFEGHTDVVTEGTASSWQHDPFGGVIEDGRLYGRGAADMKGGVAAMIHAAETVRRTGRFPGRLVVAALVDEEGYMLGAKHFVSRGHARGVDGAIICEPEGGEVCIASKGAIRLRVTANGRMAHGAMPDHGVNPIPALGALIQFAANLEQKLQKSPGKHPYLGLPFITPTVIRAGEMVQLNVIPSTAEIAFDIRTVPDIDHAELLGEFDKQLSKLGGENGVSLQSEVLDDRPSFEIDKDLPLVRAVVAAHEQTAGKPPALGGVPGATDGTILWRDSGIPVVVYGPGGKWIAHQVDEYVEIDELVLCANVYARAAMRFLEGGA